MRTGAAVGPTDDLANERDQIDGLGAQRDASARLPELQQRACAWLFHSLASRRGCTPGAAGPMGPFGPGDRSLSALRSGTLALWTG